MSETERLATRRPVELRSIGGQSRSIGGVAAVFRRHSENLGGYVERVAPSFFNKSQSDGWPGVVCRYNHDDAFLLGATRNQTLRLSIDRTGLNYVVELPESRNDVLELVSRGDIGNSSFAFVVLEDDWSLSERSLPLRTLNSGRLIDVAPVSSPAYSDTTVGLRSLAQHMDAPLHDVLRLAKAGELPKLFVRTDLVSQLPEARALSGATAKAKLEARALSGATAKAQTLAKAAPKPMSGAAAVARTLAKKYARVAA